MPENRGALKFDFPGGFSEPAGQKILPYAGLNPRNKGAFLCQLSILFISGPVPGGLIPFDANPLPPNLTDGDKNMLLAALTQKDVYPKALANFMFREIIEDAHTKYHIAQEDMKVMCKEAVNRAALFIAIQTDPQLYKLLRSMRLRERNGTNRR